MFSKVYIGYFEVEVMAKNEEGFDKLTRSASSAEVTLATSKNRDERWLANYEALKAYIEEHHHQLDKHKVENRGLLSCWKYQMKKKKAGTLTEEQEGMLQMLADSRSTEHTGGRNRKGGADTINRLFSRYNIICH